MNDVKMNELEMYVVSGGKRAQQQRKPKSCNITPRKRTRASGCIAIFLFCKPVRGLGTFSFLLLEREGGRRSTKCKSALQ